MFGPGNGRIYTSLSGTPTVADRCTHQDDVGVYCKEKSFSVCSTGSARLTGASFDVSNEGILEVCVNNQWGTVCDDSWNEVGANIACQMVFKNDSSENHSTYTNTSYKLALNIRTCSAPLLKAGHPVSCSPVYVHVCMSCVHCLVCWVRSLGSFLG